MSDESSSFLESMKSPWVTAISLAIGILGLVFAIYTYYSSQKEKSLSIIVDEEITPIIETNRIQSKKFSVVDEEGKKIEGDISAFKIRIVNDGDLPIWKNEILLPLNIKLITTQKPINDELGGISFTLPPDILDYFINDFERKNILIPKVKLSDSVFNITFKILEPQDELSVTVIFSGSKVPVYEINGAIEGVSKIRKSSHPSKKTFDIFDNAFFTLSIILFTLLFSGLFLRLTGKKGSFKNLENMIFIVAILVLIFFLLKDIY